MKEGIRLFLNANFTKPVVTDQGDFSFTKEMTLCAACSQGECSELSPCDGYADGIEEQFTLQTCKSSTQGSFGIQH